MLEVNIYHVDEEGHEYNLEIKDPQTCEKIAELINNIDTDKRLSKVYMIRFVLMCIALLACCFFYITKTEALLPVIITFGIFNIYNIAMSCAGKQALEITERELSKTIDNYIKTAKKKAVNADN